MGEKADVYLIDNFRNTHPVPSRDKIESGRATKDNPPGGGEDMEKQYVTKEELKTLDTKIDGKLNTMSATIDGKLNTMSATINGRFDGLEKDNKHLSKLLWWLMGIVSAGVVLPLLALALKILFPKI
ncbi:hypothetical protein EFT87_01745 [Schleiferilactobacillus harbinensis]|uniref:hypothetical protein n=1 Tax=Schleiferilactobacillus harbinensis TaxID=304207 RepID=UPI0021A2A319|nr:hypothetical protein [Schleiferilactobacillus harbinensis]MCT2907388.1 hypothetical protein [Schleiferilactobacillus harbinensis]